MSSSEALKTGAKKAFLGRAADTPVLRVFGKKINKWLYVAFRAVYIIGISYIILSPMLTKISVSFMNQVDLYDPMVKFIPKNFTLQNYVEAFDYMNYVQAFTNTLLMSLISGILQAMACAVTGYGFARFKFKGRNAAFLLVVITMIIPPQLILTPLYLNFQNFKLFGLIPLINNGKGLRLIESFIPFIALSVTALGPRNGLYIFLARQAFRGMPKDLDEAAEIDGAGPFRIFVQIMLPGVFPIMVAIFLFSFVWTWTDSFYSFLFYSSLSTMAKELSALTQQMANFALSRTEATASNIGYMSIMRSTCVLLAILPPVILYAIFQRHFIQSIERTGIVG